MNIFPKLAKYAKDDCVLHPSIPKVCVEISQFPLIELHCLDHQAHHLLAVP